MTDVASLLKLLTQQHIEFILIGGVAAGAHGSARSTLDLDVVYLRTRQNIERLVASLQPLHPYLRGAPPGLPFHFDAETVQRGLNFTLTTDLGALDLLGEVTGGGKFEDLLPHCVEMQLFGVPVRTLGLKRLIEVKRAAGRPRDLDAVAELEALLEERQRSSN